MSTRHLGAAPAPRATARLQLHAGFTLDDAAAQVDYYARLGISHLYLSPVGTAVPGSTHGYDNTDPTRVNPELGGEDALRRLSAAARAQGMGLLLDIVPNHMATHPANAWWSDVLRHGRGSAHADWFDIDWDAPDAGGRLLLPVLDRPLEQALADGMLLLAHEGGAGAGGWQLRHHDAAWPVAPGTVPLPPRTAAAAWAARTNAAARRGRGPLRGILDAQAYRLLWWRAGSDRVNYRRFFDITSLAALRCERADVFAAVHALPLRLLAEGLIDGVRVDHVDGLTDPAGYVRRLRQALDRAGARRGLAPGSALLYVEKILAPGETLPPGWSCQGTTGYDFMDQAGALLHAPAGSGGLRALWRRSGGEDDFQAIERQAREQVLRGPLHAEFGRCLRRLLEVAAAMPALSDLGAATWARALFALCVHFPVYRTYAAATGLDEAGAGWLDRAVQAAGAGLGPDVRMALHALADALRGGDGAAAGVPAASLRRLRAGVEQLTAPLNAKAVEDTAFYRHGVLLSRNEVGSHPGHDAPDGTDAVAVFHRAVQARAATRPLALLTTATHDHKRGEDVRARLAVLSWRPQGWAGQVEAIEHAVPAAHRVVPAPFRAMLWQTLVGAWPLAVGGCDAMDGYAARVRQWAIKALREGKQYSSWTDPDTALEAAVEALVEHALDAAGPLHAVLASAAHGLEVPGARNGLAQLLLKLACPGVPDLYQGTEGWDLSLVDPDNRRPVDYAARRAWQDDTRDWTELLRHWRDGAVKARLLSLMLALRAQQPALFTEGRYRPAGPGGRRIAFLRTSGPHSLWVGALLHDAPATGSDGLLLPETYWEEEAAALHAGAWRNVLDGRALPLEADAQVPLSTLFARSPVAVWATS